MEVARLAGRDRYERTEDRASCRNGYRGRRFDTRVGTLELEIPKLRSGPSHMPSFLEPRKRSEQALLSVVMEPCVNGVSTRKVERLATQLGIDGISKSTVSRVCAGLDERAAAFRGRPPGWRIPVHLALCADRASARRRCPRRAPQGAPCRLWRPRVRPTRGDRHRRGRGRIRGHLERVHPRARCPRAHGGRARDL